jgi:hypothetical protein
MWIKALLLGAHPTATCRASFYFGKIGPVLGFGGGGEFYSELTYPLCFRLYHQF